MDLKIVREEFSEITSIGSLSIDGEFFSYTLEDKDRGLDDSMDLAQLRSMKVPGKTAIPYGHYKVGITFSNRFQKDMIQIFAVPAFEGVRIHSGAKAEDTEGCPLVGSSKAKDAVHGGLVIMPKLFNAVKEALAVEEVYIEIAKAAMARKVMD